MRDLESPITFAEVNLTCLHPSAEWFAEVRTALNEPRQFV